MNTWALQFLARTGLLGRVPVPTARRWVARTGLYSNGYDRPATQARQLLVDVSAIHVNDAGTGIQRVVRSVMQELERKPPPGYMVRRVAAKRNSLYRYVDVPASAASADITVGPDDVFLGLDLAAHLLPRHTRQLLGWKRGGMALHFVVYDLLPLTHPAGFTGARVRHLQRWARVLAVFADSLLCISLAVRGDMERWLGQSAHLVEDELPLRVIPLGGDLPRAGPHVEPGAAVRVIVDQLRPYPWILMVGTVEPRKCYAQVLDALECLWSQEGSAIALVIVGHAGWKTEVLQQRISAHPQLGRLLHWLDDASDQDLTYCYEQAGGVLVASSAEGYGLPIVEALYFGKPVLVRDIAVFREVAGSRVEYFADDRPLAFAERLRQWLAGASGRVETGNQPRMFTWQEATQRITQAIGLSCCDEDPA